MRGFCITTSPGTRMPNLLSLWIIWLIFYWVCESLLNRLGHVFCVSKTQGGFFYPVPPLSLWAQKACNYGQFSRMAAFANSQDLLGHRVEELDCTWTRMKAISYGATQPPRAGTSPHFWMCTLGSQDLALEQACPMIAAVISHSSAVGNRHPVNPYTLPCPLPATLTPLVVPSCANQERVTFAWKLPGARWSQRASVLPCLTKTRQWIQELLYRDRLTLYHSLV